MQEAEARLLAGLSHPALVTLLDAGVDLTDASAPQMFLVMDLAPDADLRRRLRSGALDPAGVSSLAWDLLGALEYVHDHGIIHRDITPANILLTEAPGRVPRAKLADFGIAVLRDTAGRSDSTTPGTAAYLSPEQVEGAPLGPETDVYSLGLVLLEAITGRPAFPGKVLDSALARLEHDPEIPADVPAGLAEVIRGMTARDPRNRPGAGEAAIPLRDVVVGQRGNAPRAQDREAQRLEAVRASGLLDSPQDPEFDRIVSLAARLFSVPMVVVAIVDEKRIWLKARIGVEAQQIERSSGPGALGGLHDGTLVIEDTATDPRLANPAVAVASPIRFYAGVPLITSEGHNLGTLALGATTPRPTSAVEKAMLEDLAALVLHEIELRLAARDVARGARQRDA